MNYKIITVILGLILVQGLYITMLEMPLVPDVYERLRVSSQIISEHNLPVQDYSFADRIVNFIYPPFADLLLSQAAILSVAQPEIVWKVLVFLFFAIFICGMYFFGRQFLSDNEINIMLILVALSPLIVRRYATFVAESFAFAFVPWIFYLLMRKKTLLAGIMLTAIGLTNFRTFGIMLIIVFCITLYHLIKKNVDEIKHICKCLLPLVLFVLPWYVVNFQDIISLAGYKNPYIHETISLPFLIIGMPLIIFGILYFVLSLNRRFNSEFWIIFLVPLFILIASFFLIAFPFGYRTTIFIIIPLSILAAISFSWIFKKRKVWKLIAVVLLCSSLVYSWPFDYSPYTKKHESTVNFIIEKYGKGTTVLADYELSYLLAYKGALVYVGSYMERFPDASVRMRDVYNFFSGKDDSALKKWKPKCIVARGKLLVEIPSEYSKVYTNPTTTIFYRIAQ